MTTKECVEWAEGAEITCGGKTQQAIKTLAAEVRRLHTALEVIASGYNWEYRNGAERYAAKVIAETNGGTQ